MNKLGKGLIGLVVILVVLAAGGYFFMQAKDVVNVKAESFDITSVEPTNDGFTLKGKVVFDNPSGIELKSSTVTYQVKVKGGSFDSVVYSGTLSELVLPAVKKTTIDFNEKINWTPNEDQLKSLGSKGSRVEVEVTGTAAFPGSNLKFKGFSVLTEFADQFRE